MSSQLQYLASEQQNLQNLCKIKVAILKILLLGRRPGETATADSWCWGTTALRRSDLSEQLWPSYQGRVLRKEEVTYIFKYKNSNGWGKKYLIAGGHFPRIASLSFLEFFHFRSQRGELWERGHVETRMRSTRSPTDNWPPYSPPHILILHQC